MGITEYWSWVLQEVKGQLSTAAFCRRKREKVLKPAAWAPKIGSTQKTHLFCKQHTQHTQHTQQSQQSLTWNTPVLHTAHTAHTAHTTITTITDLRTFFLMVGGKAFKICSSAVRSLWYRNSRWPRMVSCSDCTYVQNTKYKFEMSSVQIGN